MPFANQYSVRERRAALDEICGPSTVAPRKIPAGIYTPPLRAARTRRQPWINPVARQVENQRRKAYGQIDAGFARSARGRLEQQLYAEIAFDSENPEDAIIDLIDHGRTEEVVEVESLIEAAPAVKIRATHDVEDDPEPLQRLRIKTVQQRVTVRPSETRVRREAERYLRTSCPSRLYFSGYERRAAEQLMRSELAVQCLESVDRVVIIKDPPLPQDADEKLDALRLSDERQRENNEAHWRRFQQHAAKGAWPSRKPIRFTRESIRTAA